MKSPMWDDKLHVRTNQHAHLAIDRLRAELRSRSLRFWGKKLTQEALLASMLMWMESLGAEEVAKGISPFLTKLEALMGYEGTGSAANPNARPTPPGSSGVKKKKRRG